MRFLLDTCVVSELVKPRPAGTVVRWVAQQDEERLYLSVVTIGELHKGISKLAPGVRRSRLEEWVDVDLRGRFGRRIVPVDSAVGTVWGQMLGETEARGRALPVIDVLIAASAVVHHCVVVTRNLTDFDPVGVETLCPW